MWVLSMTPARPFSPTRHSRTLGAGSLPPKEPYCAGRGGGQGRPGGQGAPGSVRGGVWGDPSRQVRWTPLAGLQEQAQGTAATNVAGALGAWEGTRLHVQRPRGLGDQIRGVRRTPGRVRRGTAWSVLGMPTSRDTASSSKCPVGVWA